MGHLANEQFNAIYEDRFNKRIANLLGITPDEVGEIEPRIIDESTGSEDVVYAYIISFKEDALVSILNKTKRLDNNKQVWIEVYEWDVG